MQSSIAQTPENHSDRLISHLESQILVLQRQLKEKDQLANSLLEPISKGSDIIKTNQELSKNNIKPFAKKALIKQDRFIETTTTTNKKSTKLGKKK